MYYYDVKINTFPSSTSHSGGSEGLENRFSSLSESVSKRAEHLQTAVAQSVSVQEGLKGLLAWLDSLVLAPGPAQPTAQAVQDALTQNQVLKSLSTVDPLLKDLVWVTS